MHQVICKLAVVGEQQQTLRIEIETSDIIEPVRKLGNERLHRLSARFVAGSRNDPARLIEHQHDALFLRRQLFAVEPHVVPFLHGHAEDGRDAVDRDPTVRNDLFAGAPRRYAAVRHILL